MATATAPATPTPQAPPQAITATSAPMCQAERFRIVNLFSDFLSWEKSLQMESEVYKYRNAINQYTKSAYLDHVYQVLANFITNPQLKERDCAVIAHMTSSELAEGGIAQRMDQEKDVEE